MPPISIKRDPIMKPHIVGNAIIEAIRTKIDPVLILPMFAVFIHSKPSTPSAISAAAKIMKNANQKGENPNIHGQPPPNIIHGPIVPKPK